MSRSMREVHDKLTRSADDDDPGACARCGDPLPADGECDCEGDVDRDTWSGLRELRCDTRATVNGFRRTFGVGFTLNEYDYEEGRT